MLSDKEMEFMEKRVAAATAAPWITGSIPWQVWFDGGHGKICRVESCAADREFIANSRQDVPALLAEVRKLKAQLHTAQEVINKHATDGIEGLHCVDCVAENDKICDCPMLVPFWEAMKGYTEKRICRERVPGVNAMCQEPLPCKFHG